MNHDHDDHDIPMMIKCNLQCNVAMTMMIKTIPMKIECNLQCVNHHDDNDDSDDDRMKLAM